MNIKPNRAAYNALGKGEVDSSILSGSTSPRSCPAKNLDLQTPIPLQLEVASDRVFASFESSFRGATMARLVSVQVSHYKNVIATSIQVDERVTCLVGKNESG